MHLEKNVCDSLIRTLLNIKGKIKDTKKFRKVMGIQRDSHTNKKNKILVHLLKNLRIVL